MACQRGPEVVIPPGVISSQNADQVAARMLAEIAASELKLGRAIVPARIIRIQLLREGERYQIRHLDGTNPGGLAMSPDGGPGWIVEAVGTFVVSDGGRITAISMHAFHRWDDAGGEGVALFPCWTDQPERTELMEGTCR